MYLPRILIIFSILTLSFGMGCSSRVVYDESQQYVHAPNAININTASAEELEKLPHIGRKTAETIVQFRSDNGPFRRPEYLMQIRGISEKRFAAIRQYIRTE